MLGVVTFTVGSLLCGSAPGIGWLIAFRGFQAVGGSMLNPPAMSIIAGAFTDPVQRGRAYGAWSAAFGVSLGLGPLIGGALITAVSWRAAFWVNVPIGLAVLVLALVVVPESRAARPRRLDPSGQILVAVFIGALTFAIIEAPRSGWICAQTVSAFAVALVAAAVFVPFELRHPDPMIDLRLFRQPAFAGVTAIGVSSQAAFVGYLLLMSLYLQDARGFSPIEAGLYLAPAGFVIAICATISGRIITRFSTRQPLLVAGACLAGGAALAPISVVSDSTGLLVLSIVGFAVGFGFVNAPITYTAVNGMPSEPSRHRRGGGVNQSQRGGRPWDRGDRLPARHANSRSAHGRLRRRQRPLLVGHRLPGRGGPGDRPLRDRRIRPLSRPAAAISRRPRARPRRRRRRGRSWPVAWVEGASGSSRTRRSAAPPYDAAPHRPRRPRCRAR